MCFETSRLWIKLALKKVLYTNSGMFGLWDHRNFTSIVDYDSWENELLEDKDLVDKIISGTFAPININSDGAFEFEIRIGSTAKLNPRELNYLIVSSEPYLFASSGSLNASGIEFIEKEPSEEIISLDVPSGHYQMIVNLIAWDEEPGMTNEKGDPASGALPDFIVLVQPVNDRMPNYYRTKLETFESPK